MRSLYHLAILKAQVLKHRNHLRKLNKVIPPKYCKQSVVASVVTPLMVYCSTSVVTCGTVVDVVEFQKKP